MFPFFLSNLHLYTISEVYEHCYLQAFTSNCLSAWSTIKHVHIIETSDGGIKIEHDLISFFFFVMYLGSFGLLERLNRVCLFPGFRIDYLLLIQLQKSGGSAG